MCSWYFLFGLIYGGYFGSMGQVKLFLRRMVFIELVKSALISQQSLLFVLFEFSFNLIKEIVEISDFLDDLFCLERGINGSLFIHHQVKFLIAS